MVIVDDVSIHPPVVVSGKIRPLKCTQKSSVAIVSPSTSISHMGILSSHNISLYTLMTMLPIVFPLVSTLIVVSMGISKFRSHESMNYVYQNILSFS